MENEKYLTVENTNSPVVANEYSASIWFDQKAKENAWKMAGMLASSFVVPDTYRGKQGECFIAIDIAARMGVSPVFVTQNSQIVKGTFGWKGSACKALIDGCGKFYESEFVEVGEKGTDSWGYYLQAVKKSTGQLVKGTTITWQMAKDEGWVEKSGSKWKTMPEQMFKYRAAAFFARTECPDVLLGFMTTDEIIDVKGAETQPSTVKITID